MTDQTPAEVVEACEELLEHFDTCATLIRGLDDKQLNAYDLATFEGQAAGWMGTFARDRVESILAEASAAADDPTDDDEAETIHERAHAGVSDPDACDRGSSCPVNDDHGPGCDGPLNCTCQPTHDEVMAERFADAASHGDLTDRCPVCCVTFGEPPTSDDCPVPEQHVGSLETEVVPFTEGADEPLPSAFDNGERVQLVDPSQCKVGTIMLALDVDNVRVVWDDDTATTLTDRDIVRANEQAARRLSAMGHPGYSEAFASRVLRWMSSADVMNVRQAIDHVMNTENVAVR